MLDVGWGDLIDYLGDDPHTKCIVIYMESIGDARSFLSAAREVALTKPIIVIKAGRTEAAAKAAASHTGSLAGSDEVLDAAFRRVRRAAGRLDRRALRHGRGARQAAPAPRPRLAIVTNAGGPGVLATDALIENRRRARRALARDRSRHSTRSCRPPGATTTRSTSSATPTPSATPRRWRSRPGPEQRRPARDPDPPGDDRPDRDRRASCRRTPRSPASRCWRAGWAAPRSQPARQILDQAGIPTFAYPDTAARVFTLMWRSHYNLRALYETPSLPTPATDDDRAAQTAEAIVAAARAAGPDGARPRSSRSSSSPPTASRPSRPASPRPRTRPSPPPRRSAIPVVLKLHSETITHKTDVGGVQLNLADAEAVRARLSRDRVGGRASAPAPSISRASRVQPMVQLDGYELIVGSSLDPQFGPVLLFGTGGQLVEVFKDRALGLPPLNTTLARRMMEQTRIFTGARRACAAAGRSTWRRSSSSSSASASWSSSSPGSRRSTSTRCSPRPSGCWRSTPG